MAKRFKLSKKKMKAMDSRNWSNMTNIYSYFGFVVIAVPLLLIGLSVTNYITYRNINRINSNPAYTYATLLSQNYSRGSGYTFTYKFNTSNGQSYIESASAVKNAGNLSIWNQYSKGGKIKIIYYAKNPSKTYLVANLPNSKKSLEIFIFCGIAGIIAIGLGILYFFI